MIQIKNFEPTAQDTSQNQFVISKSFTNADRLKSSGWFPKNRGIMKYLMVRNIEGENKLLATARCFQCYELVGYGDISHSRIMNSYSHSYSHSHNHNHNSGFTGLGAGAGISDRKLPSESLNIIEKHYKLAVICCQCAASLEVIKHAPRTYGDIIIDYLVNDKHDILEDDLQRTGNTKLGLLSEKIIQSLFNYNEKQLMMNHIVKENEALKRNLDMEIEKHKMLSEYKSKNKEMQDSLRNGLLQASIDLFKGHKKVIDEQIAKYSEFNSSSKYAVAECRVCMLREIGITLECGHLLCQGCHDRIMTENKERIQDEADADDVSLHVDGYPCPFCKTYSSRFIKIYL